MTARPYFNQADPKWASLPLGFSRVRTFKQAGCAVASIAEGVVALGVDRAATPLSVNDKAKLGWDGKDESKRPWEPASASGILPNIGAFNGVVVGPRVEGLAKMSEVLDEALKAGNVALLNVHKNGDENRKHWVCALRIDGGDIVYADPDGGYEGRMPRSTLSGPSPTNRWSYLVKGVRVVAKNAA